MCIRDRSYSGGAFADPLGMVAVPMPGGGVVVDGGSMGGSSGGASDDSTGVIVWVKSKEAPANAILEPDPTWDCPEGFWAVPVEVGLSDNSKVEITRGLAEGQEVFILSLIHIFLRKMLYHAYRGKGSHT